MTETHGLKVSKPGFPVDTTDDKNLVYSSEFGTFRVVASGNGTVAMDGTVKTVTITHSLGFRPAFAVYSTIYTGSVSAEHYLMPYSDPIGGDGSIMPYCDTTDLKIRFGKDHAPPASILTYKYVIFYNKARD